MQCVFGREVGTLVLITLQPKALRAECVCLFIQRGFCMCSFDTQQLQPATIDPFVPAA